MTHDLHLRVTEVNIVEEPISVFSRNFVSFAFFVAKSNMYKRFNSLLGFNQLRPPRAEADSGRAIMVRNGVGGWCRAITVRNGMGRGNVRLWCGIVRGSRW